MALVVAAQCLATPALGADDYYPIKVRPAGIRLLVPDSYLVVYNVSSRKDAKRLLKTSPDLRNQGETVKHLLSEPFFAALDIDGDQYPEETISIGVTQELVLPSPDEERLNRSQRQGDGKHRPVRIPAPVLAHLHA